MTHVTCRLITNDRDQLRTLRSAVEYGLPFLSVDGGDSKTRTWLRAVDTRVIAATSFFAAASDFLCIYVSELLVMKLLLANTEFCSFVY